MAEMRLHMRDKTRRFFIQVDHTCTGKDRLKALRKADPRFKGMWIRSIMQMRPSEVPCGKVLEVTKRIFI